MLKVDVLEVYFADIFTKHQSLIAIFFLILFDRNTAQKDKFSAPDQIIFKKFSYIAVPEVGPQLVCLGFCH
jgi:hypothetical protein